MGNYESDTKPKAEGIYGSSPPEEIKEVVDFAMRKGAEKGIVSQVELYISCKDLKNVDVSSLTDSACVVYLMDNK